MKDKMWTPTVTVFVLSMLAGPAAYAFNNILQSSNSAVMFIQACGILISIMGMTFFINRRKVKNKMYYWYGLFAFTSIIDIFVAMEADGIISGCVDLYLKYGEPYLFSPWGSVASYWDGTVFFSLYLAMAYYTSNGISYRSLGIYYSAAIINSMIVLLLAACLSKSGMSWCTMLNIPYVIIPLISGAQSLSEKRKKSFPRSSNAVDMLLALLLVGAALAGLLKGLACLDSPQFLPTWYRYNVEPITMQTAPAPFAWIQGLVMLFYFVPCFAILAFGLLQYPNSDWIVDLSLLVAGATSQAGAAQIGMSLHPATLVEHQMPSLANTTGFCLFWASNILTTILPQGVAFWISYCSHEKQDNVKKQGYPNNSDNVKRKSDKLERKYVNNKKNSHMAEEESWKYTSEFKGKKFVNQENGYVNTIKKKKH